MEKTVWELIMEALQTYDVYPPNVKEGECKSKYIVVKDDGGSQFQQTSSEVHYYTIMMYVPHMQYDQIDKFVREIEGVFREKLYPMLISTGLKTPVFFDDSVKAFMVSIQYNNKVLKY